MATSESTSERERLGKLIEPLDGWVRNTMGRLTSNVHQTIAAAGLSTPIEEYINEDGQLVVRIDMPGMDPDDIEAKIRVGQLIIEGRRRHQLSGPRENVLRSEIMYGRYRRSLPLPSWVESGDVKVSYVDGVLELRLETDMETCPHTTVFKPKRMNRQSRSNVESKKTAGADSKQSESTQGEQGESSSRTAVSA